MSGPILVVSLQSLRLELAELDEALLGRAEGNVGQSVQGLGLTLVQLGDDPQTIDTVPSDGEPLVQTRQTNIFA